MVWKHHALGILKVLACELAQMFRMWAHFTTQYQQLSFLTGLLRNIRKCGQADKLPVAFTGFYNVLFFNLESLDFIIGYEYCQLFSKLTLLILKNMWAKSPRLNKYSLLVLASCVFKQKLWYETKADSSARNSITLQLIKALSTYFSFCQLDY